MSNNTTTSPPTPPPTPPNPANKSGMTPATELSGGKKFWKTAGSAVKGLAEAGIISGMVSGPIGSAISASCQANNIAAEADRVQKQANQLEGRWASLTNSEESFQQTLQEDTQAANKIMAHAQQSMAVQKAIFLRNYKNTQKVGMFLITLVFFALLIKWVFFGKNVDPFIPGLVGKKGKKRSTSRRKSKKKWWKF